MSLDLMAALSEQLLAQHFQPHILARGRALLDDVWALQFSTTGAEQRAAGRVKGSQSPYSVMLCHAPGVRLRGSCGCVYAQDGKPCKHQAALALAWRQRVGDDGLASQTIGANAPPGEPGSDPAPNRALEAPVAEAASAKKLISAALRPARDSHEWRRVGAYARKAQSVLGLLQAWTANHPSIALVGAEWALTQLRPIWEQADDSAGDLASLMTDLAAHWLAALQAAGPQPVAYANRYAKLLWADEHDLFDQASALQAMGPAAAARYGQMVQAHWEAQTPKSLSHQGEAWWARQRLLQHLRASGDSAGVLSLLRESLNDSDDHKTYIEALSAFGHPRQALQAAEAARRLFPQDRPLEALLIKAYEQDGWDQEALALRRAAFERNPDAAGYQAVLLAARAAGLDLVAERQRLWEVLDAKDAQGANSYIASWMGALRLQLWAHEGRWEEALNWLQKPHGLSREAQETFARALPPEHAEQSAELLKQVLHSAMQRATSPYTHELRLVNEILVRLSPQSGMLWLAWLRVEHRAKKRFVLELAETINAA
jgi:hypothetical protein